MSVFLETPLERATSSWEHGVLDNMDVRTLDLQTARAVVAHAWTLLGLDQHKRPPLVTEVGQHDAGYIKGAWASVSSDGLHMSLYKPCNTVTLLHEVSHAATEDPLDRIEHRRLVEREVHGRIWLTNYLFLLDRLMGPKFNTFYLRSTMPPLLQAASLPCHPVVWGVPRPEL